MSVGLVMKWSIHFQWNGKTGKLKWWGWGFEPVSPGLKIGVEGIQKWEAIYRILVSSINDEAILTMYKIWGKEISECLC